MVRVPPAVRMLVLSTARSSARAAMLAIAMNASPVAPLELLRFLRVPAIVWVVRKRTAARFCREKHVRRRRR